MKSLAAFACLVLVACGGGGGESSTPPPATTLEPVAVTITRTGNGCLISDNADAEVNFSHGVGQAKTLLWSCANINALTRVGVEAFYTFDNAQQCFLERSLMSRVGDCSKRATAPSAPTPSASVHMTAAPALVRIGGGAYALQPIDAEVDATGNLTMFGLSVELISHTVHFGATNPGLPEAVVSIGAQSISGLANFLPGQMQVVRINPLVSHTTSPGDSYTFAVTVKDSLGNSVGSTNFDVTAP